LPPQPQLGPGDLTAAVSLLRLGYIAEWVRCMRMAWVGEANADCLKGLSDRLSQEKPESRETLLADLGTRLLTLAPQNRAWDALVRGGGMTRTLGEAIASYQKLEGLKVKTAVALARKQPPGNSAIRVARATEKAPNDMFKIAWQDFG